jgi:phosphate-selective porin
MNKFLQIHLLCFILALSISSIAQDNESFLTKGSTVVLKIPMRFYGKVTKISVSGRNNYDIEIIKNNDGSLLLNKQNYLVDDWVFMQSFTVVNISTGKNKTEIALENAKRKS